MDDNILSINIDNTENVPIIIGNTSSFNISIKNISPTQRLYNLSITLTLPDGLTLFTSTLSATSSITNSDNSTTYAWINIKDLAPMEVDYIFEITLKCNSKFKNGNDIPFGNEFSGIIVGCQVDTMPRGIYDIGNEVIYKEISMTYIATRFNSIINTSKKVLKGAGTSILLNDYTQVSSATCNFINNSISKSIVNITILLDDGIRYIGNISASGADASQFLNPIINSVIINNKLYTQIYYGNINLSVNSNTTLIFRYAIWEKYNNNTGNYVTHGTVLNMSINMASTDSTLISTSNSSTNFSAMDLIINTSINYSIVDVEMNLIYTYIFAVGEYYNIKDIVINYFLSDGILYISSSDTPVSVKDDENLEGYYIIYNFPLATQNSIKTVTINAKVDSYYRYKFNSQLINLPVVAYDSFIANTDISGVLTTLLSTVTDNSYVTSTVGIGTISKQFIQGYYKNDTPKNISALAPGDLAEYKLNYSSLNLKAIQKEVHISDFFPLSADPINNLSYEYTGVTPISNPSLISPHGVDFYYGDIPGLSSSTIQFKVPIALVGTSNTNINLMKLEGINTYGYAYSNRDQVIINIGTPNLSLTKSVSGPNKSAIQANEIYTYTVKISNSNNLGTETDAFDFTLTDELSDNWCSLNTSSINVSGTGIFTEPTIQNNNIVLYINKLAPGDYLILSYNVTISQFLAPSVNITNYATFSNPYSQVYDSQSSNFQYSNLSKSASITISSLPITITKSNFQGIFKVGSQITYSITMTVPKGTISYNVYVEDILPSNYQIYLGPTYKNTFIITPVVSSNIVTMPSEDIIDARNSLQTFTYVMTAEINNENNVINTTTSTQTNTVKCFYKQSQDSDYVIITKSLAVTINHPNLVMKLNVKDKNTSIIYTNNAYINTNSILQFTLIFQNNSAISLINGTIDIPIDNRLLLSSIDLESLCTANYNSSLNKITLTIPTLASKSSGYISFTAYPQSNLNSGSNITMQSTAISYYNDISPTKIYGGETSNILNCIMQAGVSLRPNPLYQINSTTAFIVTSPGDTVDILNYFTNTGGGYDSFNLIIQKVAIPYILYIDDTIGANVPANTLFQSTLPSMMNLAPNTNKIIKITTTIPTDEPIGTRYDFEVTAQSNTSPYPESTVLNIDPSP